MRRRRPGNEVARRRGRRPRPEHRYQPRHGKRAGPGGRASHAPVLPGPHGVLPFRAAASEGRARDDGVGGRRVRRAGVGVPGGTPVRAAGIRSGGHLESFLPLFLFCILFGLSMDYEVFLLARVREEYLRTGDNTEAVGWGLEHTAAIITSAAAIMITVFGAFAFASMVPIKAMGFGLALAVFIDATVVRVVLVPATMRLLGDWNWWLPGWLDRLLPHVELENEPSRSPRNAARRDPWVAPKPALIRRRALSAWSRTWSAPRRRETSGSPPGSGAPSCPGP
jgi:MMPL family